MPEYEVRVYENVTRVRRYIVEAEDPTDACELVQDGVWDTVVEDDEELNVVSTEVLECKPLTGREDGEGEDLDAD